MAKRRWRRLSPELRREVIGLARRGASYRDIKGQVDVSLGSIGLVLQPFGGVLRCEQWESPSGTRLSLEERVEIQLGLQRKQSLRRIAEGLGRAASTISREVNHHGGRRGYKAVAAHRAAERDARRPKQPKLASLELGGEVQTRLLTLWSPQEIAAKLRLEFPDRPERWVSHETIYKSLCVQGRGELRRELHRCLRSGRAQRRHQGRVSRGPVKDMVMISERPAEVEDRAVPGHWEGDLIIGANNNSAIGTLVERSTRFVMLLHLPRNYTAAAVRDAMTAKILTLPAALRRSITWDQGSEMAQHAPVHHRHRCPRVLRRSAFALAARQQREHQRTVAPVLPQRHQPPTLHRSRPRRRRRQSQRATTRNPRMGYSKRTTQPTPVAMTA
jgi:IS30 family transposase